MKKAQFTKEAIAKVRDLKIAYCQAFGLEETNLAGRAIRADLAVFCREFSTTFHPDNRVHAALEGRREVILRINDFLNLTVEELLVKYGGQREV